MQVPRFFCSTSNTVGEILLMKLRFPGSAEAGGDKQVGQKTPWRYLFQTPPEGDNLPLKRYLWKGTPLFPLMVQPGPLILPWCLTLQKFQVHSQVYLYVTLGYAVFSMFHSQSRASHTKWSCAWLLVQPTYSSSFSQLGHLTLAVFPGFIYKPVVQHQGHWRAAWSLLT